MNKNNRILLVLIIVVVGGLYYLQNGGLEQLQTLLSSSDVPGDSGPSHPPRAPSKPKGWAQVPAGQGVVMRQRPDMDSMRFDWLMPGAVVGHYGSKGQGWLEVRTADGERAWVPEGALQRVGTDQARRILHRDRSALETRLRSLIKTAVGEKAGLKHPRSKVIDYRILSELEARSSHSYTLSACTLMKGEILGWNEFRTDYKVTLDLLVNPYKLDASEARVIEVDIIRDERTRGLPTEKVVEDVLKLAVPIVRSASGF